MSEPAALKPPPGPAATLEDLLRQAIQACEASARQARLAAGAAAAPAQDGCPELAHIHAELVASNDYLTDLRDSIRSAALWTAVGQVLPPPVPEVPERPRRPVRIPRQMSAGRHRAEPGPGQGKLFPVPALAACAGLRGIAGRVLPAHHSAVAAAKAVAAVTATAAVVGVASAVAGSSGAMSKAVPVPALSVPAPAATIEAAVPFRPPSRVSLAHAVTRPAPEPSGEAATASPVPSGTPQDPQAVIQAAASPSPLLLQAPPGPVPQPSGVITVRRETVDLSGGKTAARFRIAAAGGPAAWSAVTDSADITLSAVSGTACPGDPSVVTVTLAAVQDGQPDALIVIDGTWTVTVDLPALVAPPPSGPDPSVSPVPSPAGT